MLFRRFVPVVLFLALVSMLPAQAAGPMGHYIIGRKIISNIASGGFQAPAELKQILKDSDCQRAYCGGAIGPDLCEAKSHYGATATLSMKLLDTARAHLKAATAAHDAKAFVAAKNELAFAYGWLSHFIVDMDVHQQVNSMQGVTDAYSFTTPAQKKTHGIYEAQLTAYLRQTIWNPKDKYDVLIPYDFVASVVGVKDASVRQMGVVLKGKVAGELVLSGNCDLPREQLSAIWNRPVTQSLQEAAQYLDSPEKMENWDMDAGHISTEDFGRMRSMVIDINDGKLTSDWGKQYPVYWEAIRSLPQSEQRAKIMELMGKKVDTSIPKRYKLVLTLTPSSKAQGFNEMPGDWQQPYISFNTAIELGEHGEFSFTKLKKDAPGLGHMSTEIACSGVLTEKGELTLEGKTTGGQTYVSQYGNGPDVRFAQADKSTFKLAGTVKFTRDRHNGNKVYRVDYTQSTFEGSFDSTMTRTTLDAKGNDVSVKSATCSGAYSTKSSGIDAIDLPMN